MVSVSEESFGSWLLVKLNQYSQILRHGNLRAPQPGGGGEDAGKMTPGLTAPYTSHLLLRIYSNTGYFRIVIDSFTDFNQNIFV